jgi:hypothetical protein
MDYEHFRCSYVRGAKSDYDGVFAVIDCVDFLPKLVFICWQQKSGIFVSKFFCDLGPDHSDSSRSNVVRLAAEVFQ